MQDEITKALEEFSQLTVTKRGFLLAPAGAFFLYDNKFCSIGDYQLRLQSARCCMDTGRAELPVFFAVAMQHLFYAATPAHVLEPQLLRLVFHIECGTEPDELLRGICFARGKEAYTALFSEPSFEEMFLAAERAWADRADRAPRFPPDEDLTALQQSFNWDQLRLLAELYLRGQANNFSKGVESSLKMLYNNTMDINTPPPARA